MTKEEKQILIKDLCGRLPYHPCINICNDSWEGCQTGEFDTNLYSHHIDAFVCDRIEVKPYLRPTSSMTEEEYIKYSETRDWRYVDDDHYEYFDTLETFDYLNSHYFDYRGLIPMGLALEAPEDMY